MAATGREPPPSRPRSTTQRLVVEMSVEPRNKKASPAASARKRVHAMREKRKKEKMKSSQRRPSGKKNRSKTTFVNEERQDERLRKDISDTREHCSAADPTANSNSSVNPSTDVTTGENSPTKTKRVTLNLSVMPPSSAGEETSPSPAVTPKITNTVRETATKHDFSELEKLEFSPSEPTTVKEEDETSDSNKTEEEDETSDSNKTENQTTNGSEYALPISSNLFEPRPEMKALLAVIKSRSNKGIRASTRSKQRLNACGAIKTLASNEANRVVLAWTRGLVPALAWILNEPNSSVDERQRCLHALLHLSKPKKNSHVIFHSRGLVNAFIKCLADGSPKIRHTTSSCLALLVRTKETRKCVVKNHDMIAALASTIDSGRVSMCNESDEDTSGLCESDDSVFLNDGEFQHQSWESRGGGNRSNKYSSSSSTSESRSFSFSDESHDRNNATKRKLLNTREKIELLNGTQLNVLQVILSLSKVRDLTVDLVNNRLLMSSLVRVSGTMGSDANTMCTAIMANLTRNPKTALPLVYHEHGLLQNLVKDAVSDNRECRKCALYALQNLSCERGCRQELASTSNLLTAVTKNAFYRGHPEHQVSAVSTLKNLSDDPSNVVTLSNTPGCVPTLLALANDSNHVKLQYLACDALAAFAHWIRTSSRMAEIAAATESGEAEREVNAAQFLLGGMNVSTWNQWE